MITRKQLLIWFAFAVVVSELDIFGRIYTFCFNADVFGNIIES